jgi:hypothetical protein
MNRLYTLLLRGSPNTERYARYVVDTPLSALTGRPDILQRLIPATTDLAYANFCADQLVQLCRKSRFSDDLARLDQHNTYAAEFDQLATVSTVWAGVPAGLAPYLLEPDIFHNWAYRLLAVTVDPVGMTITINGQPQDLTWSSGTSGAVPTGLGLSLMFAGALPGTAFSCTLQLTRLPRRELLTLDAELTSCPVPWHDPYADGKDAPDPETRIAAFILNYLEHDGE